jgi:uncharacterized cupin superfamily protein
VSPPSTFPWTYSDDETAFIIEGEVTVVPDDTSLPQETVSAGSFVKFPKGMYAAAISKKWSNAALRRT